jgi:hypothetical protein
LLKFGPNFSLELGAGEHDRQFEIVPLSSEVLGELGRGSREHFDRALRLAIEGEGAALFNL